MNTLLEGGEQLERELTPEPVVGPAVGSFVLHGALAGGLVLIQLFIFFSLQAWVWNNSADLSLLTLSSFEQRVIDELDYALMNQLGISFTVPVVIWAIVTFRRQDQDALAI